MGYVTKPEALVLLPHAAEGIRALRAAGFLIVVVTNQRGVARGLMSLDDLQAVHARMRQGFSEADAELDAIYFCPHERDTCACRKPAPGLLERAASELNLDLASSLLIGDSETDVQAGQAAGVPRCFLIESDADWREVWS